MLKGEKVNLRTVRQTDLARLLELSSDIAARGQFFPLNMPTETSLRTSYDKDGFWSDDSGTLLIADARDDRILGIIVFFKPVHFYHAVEIGYILYDRAQRGKGYTSEALHLFVKYLFDHKPIYRIQIQAEPDNLPSRRVAEKAGFVFEGTARHAFVSRGKPVDINVFSLIRQDWERTLAEPSSTLAVT